VPITERPPCHQRDATLLYICVQNWLTSSSLGEGLVVIRQGGVATYSEDEESSQVTGEGDHVVDGEDRPDEQEGADRKNPTFPSRAVAWAPPHLTQRIRMKMKSSVMGSAA